MFKEDETQYCPECEKWAEKYEQLAQKYNKVLELSKKYVDSAEYCLTENDETITKLKNERNKYKKQYRKNRLDRIKLEKENELLQQLKDEDSLRVVELIKENEELKDFLETIKRAVADEYNKRDIGEYPARLLIWIMLAINRLLENGVQK